MKDLQQKEKFIELRAKNISFDKIEAELRVNKKTLIRWSKELKTEISNMKAIELEKLQELYIVSKTKRIEAFGQKLKEILQELDKRDLKEVDTAKLLELAIKYAELLKKEEVATTFTESIANVITDKWEV